LHCSTDGRQSIGVQVKGKVKWFSRMLGYGFIDSRRGEVFFHRDAVDGREGGNLEPDERVEFTLRTTEKGLRAIQVRRRISDE